MGTPLVQISTTPIPEDKELIFSIDGVDYFIPKEVPGSVAVEAMVKAREAGDIPATVWAMEQMLGEEGLHALRTCKTVRKEEVIAVQDIIRERVFGLAEQEGKG